MNGLVSWWARNPVAANLLMIGIVVSGVLAFQRLEREVFPTFQVNFVEVSVAWPGAAPQEVEEQIIIRIEEALADLDNIDRLRSTALEGVGFVIIEANPRVDMGEFINKVKLRVDGIAILPSDVEPPRVREILTRNELIRLSVFGDVDERTLKRTAERIRDEIAVLPGASIVELFGVRNEEVSIELSEEAMRRYGLTFDEVARAVRGTSVNLSSGRVRTETGEIQLRARNLADTQRDFEDIIVRQTPDGAVITVGDVATVIDGFEDVNLDATYNGMPAVLVQVMTSERMNVVRTSESVNGWLETAQDNLPPGVQVELWYNQSKIYFDRMATISRSAFLGLALVFIVLILFLRPKVAIWVTIGIATAFAGAFVLLPAYDVSLNTFTLFAFLLVIGVVVDDAIIVGEMIHSRVEKGDDPLTAATYGAQLVLKPVIFAVVTTMIAFSPWLFLSGVQVQFTRQLSLIIILALTFSLIEALLILPAHLANMKPRTTGGPLSRIQARLANSLTSFAENQYRPFVAFCVDQRYLTTAVFFFFLVLSLGFLMNGYLRFAFVPEIENEMIAIDVELPEGTPYARALEVLDQMRLAQAAFEEDINAERASAGGEAPPVIDSWYTRARDASVLALVQLAPPELRDMSAKEVALRLRDQIGDIPDAEDITVNYTINQVDPGLQLAISAPDLDVLRAAVADLMTQLRTYESLYDVRDNLRSATDEIRLTLKPGAETLGVTLGEVSRQVRQAYFGEQAQRLPRDGQDVRVFVRYPEEARESLQSLQNFRVRTADGREVPLLSVADVTFAPGLARIDRRERQRSAVISAELRGDVRGQILRDLDENFFPQWEQRYPSVTRGAIGAAEGEAEFLAEISSLYIIAFLSMYAMLAIAFRSYWQPLLIMTAIPFGYMGAVYGHMMFGMTMALFSYFGIAAAAGVVVNDNLVLVDTVNRLRAQGMGAVEALIEAGVSRFRPILLTSVTTFIGLVPMMAERSTQAQFLKPTVVALAFGVIFATFVTLLMVPALYGVGVDIARLARRWWTGEPQPLLGQGATRLHRQERDGHE